MKRPENWSDDPETVRHSRRDIMEDILWEKSCQNGDHDRVLEERVLDHGHILLEADICRCKDHCGDE